MGLYSRIRGIFIHSEKRPGTGEPRTPKPEPSGPASAPAAPSAQAVRLVRHLRIRGTVSRGTALALGLIPLAILLALWWLATRGASVEERFLSPVILPAPGEVMASLPRLWFERGLMRSIATSLGRVAGGFAIAAMVALPLGIAMGAFTRIKALFNPISVMGSYLPIAAIVPLTLSWFGTGEWQKIMFLAIAGFVVLLPLVVKAVDDVDGVYLDTALTLGASPWQAVTRVLVSIAAADIFNALRLTFAVGWTYIILAEMVDAESGLGNLIIASQRRGPREHIYLVLVVIMAMAFLVDQVFIALGRALFPHRQDKR